MTYEACLLHSLDTLFTESALAPTLRHTSFFRNEAFSFQVGLRCNRKDPSDGDVVELEAVVQTHPSLANAVTLYTVELVPSVHVGLGISDDWFLRKTPGLYPDRLQKRADGRFTAVTGSNRCLWITVNENIETLPAGDYPLTVSLKTRADGKEVARLETELHILDELLPDGRMPVTNWMHYDCMAHFSGTKPLSAAWYKTVENYMRLAAKNGQNMILTPAFTPPLDTPVGEERMTVQLVKVEKTADGYTFDFSHLKRFVESALSCGIEYFEHSHLFTQWGADHAPKIVVRENGRNKKLFGWHTDAASEEYTDFLHAYLTALKGFLKENGYEKRFFFHTSDEPIEKFVPSYTKAADLVHRELAGFSSGDALSEYVFYEKGLVQTPIVATDHIGDFLGRAKPLWAYYTGLQSTKYESNRLIGMPLERGRVLGVQLYYFAIDGFLHWGFNAHHNRLSRRLVDPCLSADMDGDFAGGTSYLVYPNGFDAEPSPRLIAFRDQMQDVRALTLLEKLSDRETVCALVRSFIPDISFNCRVSSETLLALRAAVNEKIAAAKE